MCVYVFFCFIRCRRVFFLRLQILSILLCFLWFDFMMSFCKMNRRPNYVNPLTIQDSLLNSLSFRLNKNNENDDEENERKKKQNITELITKQRTRLRIKSDTAKIKMETNGFFMKLCHPLKSILLILFHILSRLLFISPLYTEKQPNPIDQT